VDVKALYQEAFSDNDAFTEFFLGRKPMHTVTIEEDGELVALACLVERALVSPHSPSVRLPVGMVSAVCVREALRGKGYGKQVMKRVEALARERGLAALYLSPDVPDFYRKLGYRDVMTCELRFTDDPRPLDRLCKNAPIAHAFDGNFDALSKEKITFSSLCDFLASVEPRKVRFSYAEADAKRLCDEVRVAGGGWIVTDKRGICALLLCDKRVITRSFIRDGIDPARLLRRTRTADGAQAFHGYGYLALSSGVRPTLSASGKVPEGIVFLQELALDPAALKSFLGKDPIYRIAERY